MKKRTVRGVVPMRQIEAFLKALEEARRDDRPGRVRKMAPSGDPAHSALWAARPLAHQGAVSHETAP